QVIGFGAPHGELVRFLDGRPAWISQAIPGQTLQAVLTNLPQQLDHLDPISATSMILMAMLINPEDGKPANYIMEPLPHQPDLYRLASPDNDQGLVPAFVKPKPKEGLLSKKPEIVVQVKTVLYCLDLMNQPIPHKTRQAFLKQDPLTLMREWIGSMQILSKQYQCLYPDSGEVRKIFKSKECFIGLPFQKDMISHLYSKWERLQDYLAQDIPTLTPMQLLSKLEPRLANRYREAFERFPQANQTLDRFVWVDGPFYRQKGNSSWSTLTPSGSILTSQNIPLQESILDSIRQDKSLGPLQALQELNSLIKQKGQSGLSLEHLKSDYAREQFLKDFDFAPHPLSKQRQLLNQLIPYGAGLNHLSLKNCLALTDTILQTNFLQGQLVHLDLRGCSNITHGFLSHLAQTNPGLEELNLSGVIQLRYMAQSELFGYSSLVFNQLLYLNLNNCRALETIDIEASELNHLWVEGSNTLKHLKMQKTNKVKLLKIQAPLLRTASFQEAAIKDEGLHQLLAQVSNPVILELINCPNIGKDVQTVFVALFQQIKSPKLNLSSKKIGDVGAQALAPALQHNIILRELILMQNQIGAAGAQALAQALEHNTTLKGLSLSCNQIGDAGAQALAYTLQYNATLTKLILRKNKIGATGVQALADALKYNKTLTKLYLNINQISDERAQALAQALQHNTTLRNLDLNGNKIGDAGAQALAYTLQYNATLTKLILSFNQIGYAGAQALALALQHNATLTTLNLRENEIGEAGKRAFKRVTTCKVTY
ncbi:MAG: hypothetical protein K0M45_11985, partial [Candidatus Paracaedibacteraceae bacterium]|nr:hypothetical protein [Candidatus Paracaedibacteraceae bacterium]